MHARAVDPIDKFFFLPCMKIDLKGSRNIKYHCLMTITMSIWYHCSNNVLQRKYFHIKSQAQTWRSGTPTLTLVFPELVNVYINLHIKFLKYWHSSKENQKQYIRWLLVKNGMFTILKATVTLQPTMSYSDYFYAWWKDMELVLTPRSLYRWLWYRYSFF